MLCDHQTIHLRCILERKWSKGPCGFRPFDFHSILKIENQNFTSIVIFNV